MIDPPPSHSKLPEHRVNSFAFQCDQWEPIQNSQLIGKYKENQFYPGKTYDRPLSLPFETARAQSELFAFQCDQWEPIWNSQLIGKYKEKSVLSR